jgi:hypothetical protein
MTGRSNELSEVTGIGSADDLSIALRRLVPLGKGDQAQFWVLARLQKNLQAGFGRANPELPGEPDRLCALAFSILHDRLRAIVAQAKVSLGTRWFRREKSSDRR